jgi:Collagen triple helix repeat (20 copies)
MSTSTNGRAIAVLAAAGALLLAALAAAPQANAATYYACMKKNGTVRVFTKKPKCKKGESKLSFNAQGPAGKNGTNGTNGTNGANGTNGTAGKEGSAGKEGLAGKEGAAGQPQKAVAFNASAEAVLLESRTASLFSLSGVSVRLDCVNVLFANVINLEGSGPASTRAVSGMVDSRANNESTQVFQQPAYRVGLGGFTVFGSLVTNTTGELVNVGHVNATITTPSAVIVIDTFIEVGTGSKACQATGVAFSIPT